jgi:hypothetical protein
MKIEFRPQALRECHFRDYAIRFLFGGLVTVMTGLIARHYGPTVGGLFLAFPAIFPASATLVAKQAREKHGGDQRWGQKAAAVDAAGAAMGSLGLLAFAALVWWQGPRLSAAAVLSLAALAWAIVSLVFWAIRQKI